MMISGMLGASCLVCLAAVNEVGLEKFWTQSTNMDAILTASHVSKLHELGVEGPNMLEPYLAKGEWEYKALCSMQVLTTKSNKLDNASIRAVSKLLSKSDSPDSTKIQSLCIRLLLNRVDDDYAVNALLNCVWGLSAESADKFLYWVGEVDSQNSYGRTYCKKLAIQILNLMIGQSVVAMPSRGRNSMDSFAATVRTWPLYKDTELSEMCAVVLIERVKYPIHISATNVEPTISFLLNESKASPEFVSKRLSDLVIAERRYSRPVLWLLAKSRTNNPVASKSIDYILESGNPQVKVLYQSIADGKLTRADAFEKPLQAAEKP